LIDNHFFMIFQPEATMLPQRLPALKTGSVFSEAFDKLTARLNVLQALKVRAMSASQFRER
jgi:hypothetical protein